MRALPALSALALAAVVGFGLRARAYVVLWPALDDAKRGVHVFNNFGDPEANDDSSVDPRWPGWSGAPRAIWKGACEWGSRLHGDGGGDPTQTDGIGSGGANLDPFFEGLVASVGAPNDNVASELNGTNAGVIAFTELPPNDGWRVRFYANPWILDDDTNGPIAGAQDLQGVFTHEYGHCLGLDHSPVPGATMEAAPASTVPLRSIESDDVQGLQAIYGGAAAGKPVLRALTLSAGVLTLLGEQFGASDDVHFLGASASGVASTHNATVLALALPGAAQAGDVQVVLASGPASGMGVSNAWPLDPAGCPPPATYCAAKSNSQGCLPTIGFSGAPSASAPSGFLIEASNVINRRTGLLLYAYAPGSAPFQGGILCLSGALKRTPPQNSGGSPSGIDCSGSFSFDFNASIASGVDPLLLPGTAVYAQYVYRDPPSSFGWGMSEALAFTICP